MTEKDLFQEIETLSQAQLEKNPNYIKESFDREVNIEPFDDEREAIEFANYCAEKILNETR